MKLTKEWITGFVDADGCFTIDSKKLRHFFFVSQDQKSVDVLYALKKEFGCGTVNPAGGTMYNYQISKEEHIRDICIPFFIRYPLQTGKKYVFQRWARSFREHMIARNKDPGIAIPPVSHKYGLTCGWFRGFVDAEGCFYASIVEGYIQPRFILGARAEEKELLKACHSLIQCGTLLSLLPVLPTDRKECKGPQKKEEFETLQVSHLEDLERKLVPFFETRGSAVLLRTRKRIAFQKFRKIVRIMIEKRHLNREGFEKCKKYVIALNKENNPLNF